MKKDSAYGIDLTGMPEGVNEYDYHIDKAFFEERENSDILGADVDVALDVTRRRDTYELDFHCEGTLQVACDRCLEAVPVNVDEDYRVMVRFGEEYDDSADDILVIPANWTRLDVAPLIYDTLLLAIPLRCVHKDGECNSEMTDLINDQLD